MPFKIDKYEGHYAGLLHDAVREELLAVATPEQQHAVSVHRIVHDQWEFHGPDNFYWRGRAYNPLEARAKGWMVWLYRRRPRSGISFVVGGRVVDTHSSSPQQLVGGALKKPR